MITTSPTDQKNPQALHALTNPAQGEAPPPSYEPKYEVGSSSAPSGSVPIMSMPRPPQSHQESYGSHTSHQYSFSGAQPQTTPQQPQGTEPMHWQHNNGGIHMEPPPQARAAPERTPQQLGEEYRAALFAECAQGRHQPTRKYGPCGIITAIVCFPCGLLCLFSDSEYKCDRCGVVLPS